MQKLTLTKEQREKLLEMCNKLFPEYKWTYEYSCSLGAHDYDFDNLVYSELNEKDHLYKGQGIHWFEFVMGELTNKLYKLFFTTLVNKNLLLSINPKVYFVHPLLHHNHKTLHPVDYLYENFKKLK
jgi:hypothetical protein